jgi:hypothetical protein
MAVDKLVDSNQLDANLTSVANAIRAKGGTSAQMAFPTGFVSAVQAIPTGTTPTGTKQISINQNGTTIENVAAYANAEITVDVSGGGGYSIEEIATNSAFYRQNLVLPPNITTVGDGAFFAKCLASVSGAGVVEIGKKAFAADAVVGRSSFTFDFPALETTGTYAFANNDFGNSPVVITALTCAQSLFEGCINLPRVKFTRAQTIGRDLIYNVSSITSIVINSTPTTIDGGAFRRATALTDIYVPWSEGAVANAPWGATAATIHYNTAFDANGDPT